MGKKKILIVEDDQMIASMYKTKFEADGFDCLMANEGPSGLEMVKKEKPDLVMLDVMLPQLDGFSILKEIKSDSKTKGTPVIMLTNLGTEEDKAKGQKMGAIDYLVKASLTPAEISKKIKEYLK
ncbi:MAG: response regulator [Patescibacteria group bacterium]|jgi:DNA-binding response OmpR family regulator